MPGTDDRNQVLAALTALPGYAAADSNAFLISRQGGLTNRVFRVDHPILESVVVRLAGEGTGDYINREIELHNARQAALAGVSPDVLHALPEEGLMITRLVPDIVTMTPALFVQREDAVRRAGIALKKLHTSGVIFQFHFELFSMIEDYLKVLETKTVDLPVGYHDVVKQSQPLKKALQVRAVPPAPCHCDPLCENFLDDAQQMWVVDWEYSGMNDPWWDLGDLSVEADFNASQDEALLQAYCNGDPAEHEHSRMLVYKAMCDLLWTLWGLIQHADGNSAEDFWAYATGRFARCQELMNSLEFNRACQRL